ncbi:MAG: sugar ABC transporter permease [Armatimonadota bacterium]|nr:sugar ABC transporter permease [Armatimonadota bacterium]MDR7402082.1 sugar ABC transporter permease [Armatimonadota bacterium]MDR7437092.1 sugar ABC transporter permease [Armatimonadota bacterium]MDR7472437.1 sugar ABC transporter permease [Armatimonadota bacterium]MDR7506658.1 sugar ABC transporter permease [Armatimonadota bacterium]
MAVADADLSAAPARPRVDWTPYLLVVPVVLFLAVFFLYPMAQAIWLAVDDPAGGLTPAHLRRMAADLYFRPALRFTLVITALAVPLQVALGLAIALLVHARFRGHGAFLYLTALPLGISDLAAGLIWLSIFTERGYLNALLQTLGVIAHPVVFLTLERPGWLLAAIVAAEVWRATAIVMVILLAGLQLIPRDYAETAAVFGAGPWQTLRHVILPLLRPSLQTALIIRTILAFQLFATVVALAGRQVPVLAGEAYFWYALYRSPQVASAYAVLILLLSGAVTWVYLRGLAPRAGEGRA